MDSDKIVFPKESMNGNCERCQMEGPLWAYDASENVTMPEPIAESVEDKAVEGEAPALEAETEEAVEAPSTEPSEPQSDTATTANISAEEQKAKYAKIAALEAQLADLQAKEELQ